MTYALVDDPDAPTAITEVRGPRSTEVKRLDGTELRRPEGGWTDLQLKRCGLLPVATVPKPADTATTTHDRTVELVAGVPTQVWTERPKTQAELDAEAEQAAQQVRTTDLTQAIATLRTWADDAASTNVNNGNNTQVTQVLVNRLGLFFDRFADLLENQGY